MTKQEYEEKYKQADDSGGTVFWGKPLKIKDEYIESLEIDNRPMIAESTTMMYLKRLWRIPLLHWWMKTCVRIVKTLNVSRNR